MLALSLRHYNQGLTAASRQQAEDGEDQASPILSFKEKGLASPSPLFRCTPLRSSITLRRDPSCQTGSTNAHANPAQPPSLCDLRQVTRCSEPRLLPLGFREPLC